MPDDDRDRPEPALSSITKGLLDKTIAIHGSLTGANLPHAFGGALALAWYVRDPRATRDVDVNVFIEECDSELLRGAFPAEVDLSREDLDDFARDGQARLWWGETPVDVFLNTTPLHHDAAERVSYGTVRQTRLPILSGLDTAIFKVFFNRSKDWVDLEEMRKAGAFDAAAVRDAIVRHLGESDERVRIIDRLARTGRAFQGQPRRESGLT